MDMSRFNHALCICPHCTRERYPFFPPTGLEYVASALTTRVPRVTLADLRHDPAFQPEWRLHEFIRREGVDLLAVSVNWEFNYEEVTDMINRLSPGIFTIVGGNEATVQVEETMERCPEVDALVRGEGEEIVIELASGRPLGEIAGISWRRNGTILHNENRAAGPIEGLPGRDRGLRQLNYDLAPYGVNIKRGGFDTVLTSRGCPFKCKFCPLNLNPLGRKRDYGERSAESVFEEVKSLDADIIYFCDDNMFVNPKRIERLCDMLIEAKIRKKLIGQARVEIARSPRLLDKLVRAGFKALLLGIESANDRSLKIFNKGFTIQQVREYFKVFKKFPMWYQGYFIIGNIDETEREMLAIPRFAHELGLDSVSIMHLKAPKFTPIREMVEATPGYYIGSGYRVYSDRYSIEDINRIRRRITHDFYTPIQIARTLRKIVRIGLFKPWEFAALTYSLALNRHRRHS